MYSIVIENTMIIVHLKYIYNASPLFFQISDQFANPFAPPLTSNPGSAFVIHQILMSYGTKNRQFWQELSVSGL